MGRTKRVDWLDYSGVRTLVTRAEALLRATLDPDFDDGAQGEVSGQLAAVRRELKQKIAASEDKLKQTA